MSRYFKPPPKRRGRKPKLTPVKPLDVESGPSGLLQKVSVTPVHTYDPPVPTLKEAKCRCIRTRRWQMLGILRQKKEFCDVVLISSDQVMFYTHSLILGACSSFLCTNLNQMKIKPSVSDPVSIYLGDLDSETLGAILDFIYGSPPHVRERKQKVLRGAMALQLNKAFWPPYSEEIFNPKKNVNETVENLIEGPGQLKQITTQYRAINLPPTTQQATATSQAPPIQGSEKLMRLLINNDTPSVSNLTVSEAECGDIVGSVSLDPVTGVISESQGMLTTSTTFSNPTSISLPLNVQQHNLLTTDNNQLQQQQQLQQPSDISGEANDGDDMDLSTGGVLSEMEQKPDRTQATLNMIDLDIMQNTITTTSSITATTTSLDAPQITLKDSSSMLEVDNNENNSEDISNEGITVGVSIVDDGKSTMETLISGMDVEEHHPQSQSNIQEEEELRRLEDESVVGDDITGADSGPNIGGGQETSDAAAVLQELQTEQVSDLRDDDGDADDNDLNDRSGRGIVFRTPSIQVAGQQLTFTTNPDSVSDPSNQTFHIQGAINLTDHGIGDDEDEYVLLPVETENGETQNALVTAAAAQTILQQQLLQQQNNSTATTTVADGSRNAGANAEGTSGNIDGTTTTMDLNSADIQLENQLVLKQEPMDIIEPVQQMQNTNMVGHGGNITVSGISSNMTTVITAFVCPICGMTFQRRAALMSHGKIHPEFQNHKCTICSKTFTRLDFVKRHVRCHLGFPHECPECHRSYKEADELQSHHYKMHMKQKKVHECTICGKVLKNAFNLKEHTRVHTGDKPFLCDACPMRFARSVDLRNHQFVHNDELRYFCHICGKRFRRPEGRRIHLRNHLGVKPYKCNMCEKSFASRSSYNIHMRNHHRSSDLLSDGQTVVTTDGSAADLTINQSSLTGTLARDINGTIILQQPSIQNVLQVLQ